MWARELLPTRFHSQVFSTSQRLPSRPKLCGLVSCPNRSWDYSSRGFPSLRVAHPSRGHVASLRSFTDVLRRRHSVLITAGFHDVHAYAQLPASPNDYGIPFHAPRRKPFPVTLEPSDGTVSFRQLHPLRSLDPLASPFTSTRVAPSPRSILSWIFASLELSPSPPRVL